MKNPEINKDAQTPEAENKSLKDKLKEAFPGLDKVYPGRAAEEITIKDVYNGPEFMGTSGGDGSEGSDSDAEDDDKGKKPSRRSRRPLFPNAVLVYAGPEGIGRMGRVYAGPDPEKADSMKAVYAGPDWFAPKPSQEEDSEQPKMALAYAAPMMSPVYAGPEMMAPFTAPPLPSEDGEGVICPGCGTKLSNPGKFCPECGYWLAKKPEPPVEKA